MTEARRVNMEIDWLPDGTVRVTKVGTNGRRRVRTIPAKEAAQLWQVVAPYVPEFFEGVSVEGDGRVQGLVLPSHREAAAGSSLAIPLDGPTRGTSLPLGRQAEAVL